MAMGKLLPSNLIVPAESFSADRLAKNAHELGYAQAETLEALVWDYELYAQLQKRISGLCHLKGGAAVQLYVPDDRYQDLPKHLYDLDSLMLSLDGIETFKEAARWLPILIGEQGRQWKGAAGVESVMDDLETSLLNIAIIDYSDERRRYGNAVQRLETLYLPGGARMHLHRWATMAARALAIARLLRLILQEKENITQALYSQAERLANEINRYPKPSQLAKILYERLPASILPARQLRGSPPERLFWLLVNWNNLNELEDVILGM